MRITALLGSAALLAAAPAFAGDMMKQDTMSKTTVTTTKTMGINGADFAMYDADRDGRVNFGEYYKYAKKDGVSSTLAAQRFNKMTSGTYYLDETGFQTAMSYDGAYYDSLPYQSTTTLSTNTVVLDSTEMSPADPLNADNPVDVYDEFEPTGTYSDPLPAATVEPGYRFEDQVGGDLTQTDNPLMQVRPQTIGTETEVDIDIN